MENNPAGERAADRWAMEKEMADRIKREQRAAPVAGYLAFEVGNAVAF